MWLYDGDSGTQPSRSPACEAKHVWGYSELHSDEDVDVVHVHEAPLAQQPFRAAIHRLRGVRTHCLLHWCDSSTLTARFLRCTADPVHHAAFFACINFATGWHRCVQVAWTHARTWCARPARGMGPSVIESRGGGLCQSPTRRGRMTRMLLMPRYLHNTTDQPERMHRHKTRTRLGSISL